MEEIVLNILIWFGLYLIVCLSLNLEYGFGGIPNFGRAFAVLIGAFAVGGMMNRVLMSILGIDGAIAEASGEVRSVMNEMISKNPIMGVQFLISCLLLAAVLGALFGVLFILPSAKLSQYYLAMTLFAISEVVFMVGYLNPHIIGGYYGVSTPDPIAFVLGEHRLLVFSLLVLGIAFSFYLLVSRMINTPYGRLLRAMREDEAVVEAHGKNVMTLRIKTCAVGSAIAAISGALFSLYLTTVIATAYTRTEWTFYPFLMIILGGLGNNKGVMAGVFLFVAAKVLLTTYKWEIASILRLPFEVVWLEYTAFGILMLTLLMYKPEGLIKEKPILTRPIKRKVSSLHLPKPTSAHVVEKAST